MNLVVSNQIDEKYKYLADLTQRTGVMLPKAHKLAQFICQQQGRPIRTAKGGKRALASRGEPSDNEELRDDKDELRVNQSRTSNNQTAEESGAVGEKKAAADVFDEDLSVLQNFKKLEDTVSDLASGYANYITAEESDAELADKRVTDVPLFSGSEPHTYHSKALPSDDEQREKVTLQLQKRRKNEQRDEEEEEQRDPERSPRSAASGASGRPPKPAPVGKKSGSPLRGGGSRGGAKARPGSKPAAAAGTGSAPSSRKGVRRSAGSDSNQETDTDAEPAGGSRGGLSSAGKKKKRKVKSRSGSAGAAGVDYDDLINNEDDDESMYRLDRVVGEALFDFNLLNMNLRGTCGTPQDAVSRSLSGYDEQPPGSSGAGAAGAAGSGKDGSSYSLYTSSRGKYSTALEDESRLSRGEH